jgi:hypothetical protein
MAYSPLMEYKANGEYKGQTHPATTLNSWLPSWRRINHPQGFIVQVRMDTVVDLSINELAFTIDYKLHQNPATDVILDSWLGE